MNEHFHLWECERYGACDDENEGGIFAQSLSNQCHRHWFDLSYSSAHGPQHQHHQGHSAEEVLCHGVKPAPQRFLSGQVHLLQHIVLALSLIHISQGTLAGREVFLRSAKPPQKLI